MTTPSPTLRLIHLSDLHLVEEGKLLRDVMDTPARMRQALDKLVTLDPAAIIVSGDLGQRNHYVHDDVAAYFGHFQDHLKIPFITVGGNHDPIDSIGTAYQPILTPEGAIVWDEIEANGEHIRHDSEPRTTLVSRVGLWISGLFPIEWLL